MHTPLMMPFQMTPRSITLLPLTFTQKNAFSDFVAAWDIVFHKHILFLACCNLFKVIGHCVQLMNMMKVMT